MLICKHFTTPEICSYTTLGNAEVIVLPFTTMNSYQISQQMNSDKHDWQLLSPKKSQLSHHVTFITSCAQNVRLQHECKRKVTDAIRQQHVQ